MALINHRDLLFIILEAGKSQIKSLADLVSGESQLPWCEKSRLPDVLTWQEAEGALLDLLEGH